jgi:hypothetical protein
MTSESVSFCCPVDLESTAKQLVASTDDLNSQRFYHDGTRTELRPGDPLLCPVRLFDLWQGCLYVGTA